MNLPGERARMPDNDARTVETAAPQGAPQPLDIRFDYRGDRLIGLGMINGVLIALTLGIYSFWAKTEVRRRLWSFTRLNGEPLNYTGTGRELMFGFLVAFVIVVLPLLLASAAAALAGQNNQNLLVAVQSVIYVIGFYLFQNAYYRAQRYRLSRTEWRGIRGWLEGNPNSYAWVAFYTLAIPVIGILMIAGGLSWLTGPKVGGVIVVAGFLAVFWILPWRSNKLRGLITRDMRFGALPLSYDGTPGPLYRRFALVWVAVALIVLATLAAIFVYAQQSGILDLWTRYRLPPPVSMMLPIVGIVVVALIIGGAVTASYRARQYQHFAHHTSFQNGRFAMAVSGPGLAWLTATNWLILIAAVLIALFCIGAASMIIGGAFPNLAYTSDTPTLATTILTIPTIFFFAVALTTARSYMLLRTTRYLLSRTQFDGTIDLAQIEQSAAERSKRGEGLAQVFDIDAF